MISITYLYFSFVCEAILIVVCIIVFFIAKRAMKRCDELLYWNGRLLENAERLQEDRDELRKRFLPGGWYAPGTTPAESAELRRAYRAKWN